MNEIPVALELYRNQLRDAVERDLARRRRRLAVARPSRRVALPAAGVAVAGIAASAVVLTAWPHAQSADAAVLRRVATALDPPAGTILHEQAQITIPGRAGTRYELWAQADAPHAYRVIKWGYEGTWNGSTFSSYDATSNTVTTGPAAAASASGADDPAATLRALVQDGGATVDETTTIGGVQAYKLTVTQSPDPFLVGTAYVAASDYRPLEIDTVTNSERIVFQTYEYLRASAANLQLLDLAAQHPGATVKAGGNP
jgi:hypothetical protein